MSNNNKDFHSNNELLAWAVENITEWDENYTHLRSASNRDGVLFTSGGEWSADNYYNTWKWVSGVGSYTLANVPYPFTASTPQVITKEEWLIAKAAKNTLITSSEAIQGHIHAELMVEYALLAKMNPEPWKEFDKGILNDGGELEWINMTLLDAFESRHQYRRKPTPPKTMNIGGIVVEAWPLEEAEISGNYFEVLQHYGEFITHKLEPWRWAECTFYDRVLKAGYIFSTKEQAEAVANALNTVYNRAIGRE